jgi:hypothetical protein
MKPKLIKAVPKEICSLLEVARGAMIYGYFFYPLYTLGCEQLFRVADTATTYKCNEVKAPHYVIKCTFEDRLKYLISKDIIPKNKENTWFAIRKFRNLTSHPKCQSILPPGQAIGLLERIVDEINSLFKCP